ncbi:MAG: hypothetical protein HC906_14315 [Bacteroidales bacterium]|nr:hypothetical protein [Bacteroidales bacterium]
MKKIFSVFLILCGLLTTFNALPQEYELYDGVFTYTFDECRDDASFRFSPPPDLPADWTNPVNYNNGKLYIRYEVISQPTNTSAQILIALYQDSNDPVNPTYWKESTVPHVEIYGPGDVGTFDLIPSHINGSDATHPYGCWGTAGECVELDRADEIYKYEFQLWGISPYGKIKKTNADLWADSAKWFPMQIRATLVLVAQGTTFSGWNYWLNNTPPFQPDYTINYTTEKTNETVTTGVEYSFNQVNWFAGYECSVIASGQ